MLTRARGVVWFRRRPNPDGEGAWGFGAIFMARAMLLRKGLVEGVATVIRIYKEHILTPNCAQRTGINDSGSRPCIAVENAEIERTQ